MRVVWLALLFAAQTSFARAQSGTDGLDWVERVYSATNKLSYTGIFVYQHGQLTETSRISRLVDASGARERVEVLDGSPREIIRVNDEVQCYLPGSMTVKVEKLGSERPLLPILPSNVKGLPENYLVKKGDIERVAGVDCQVIALEPRDKMRYGHKLWADTTNGMLLKAQTLDENNQVVEQFMFTQITVGNNISQSELRSKFQGRAPKWRIEESGGVPTDLSASGWTIKDAPRGFRKVMEMKRSFAGSPNVGHIVLSDGIAAVSVFIEPDKAASEPLGLSRRGAINIFTRKLDNSLVTVVGETPAECVKAIAAGIEHRQTP